MNETAFGRSILLIADLIITAKLSLLFCCLYCWECLIHDQTIVCGFQVFKD